MYMLKSKKEAVLGHNFITLKNKNYIFEENNLIVLREAINMPDISLLKLYSDYVKDTKFIKFHFSNKHAVFFFLYRTEFGG